MKRSFTALIEREDDGYVALCPELDIVSQGDTIELARANWVEALELFFETAASSEIEERLHDEVFVTRLEPSNQLFGKAICLVNYLNLENQI